VSLTAQNYLALTSKTFRENTFNNKLNVFFSGGLEVGRNRTDFLPKNTQSSSELRCPNNHVKRQGLTIVQRQNPSQTKEEEKKSVKLGLLRTMQL